MTNCLSPGPCPLIRGEIRMVGNGWPITGCLIHRVTKYSGFQDACVRFSFQVLPYHLSYCHHSNGIKLWIVHFCRWLQHKKFIEQSKCHYSQCAYMAIVIPLSKKYPPVPIDNDIRPISLTPIIAKVFELLVLKWVDVYVKPQIDDN